MCGLLFMELCVRSTDLEKFDIPKKGKKKNQKSRAFYSIIVENSEEI
jgi:hypothetical protein